MNLRTRPLHSWLVAALLFASLCLPPHADAKPPQQQAQPAKKTQKVKKKAPQSAPKKAQSKPRQTAETGVSYGQRRDAMALAEEIALQQQLDPAWVSEQLAEAQYIARITQWVLPSASPGAKNWAVYRQRVVDPVRIRAGVRFWRDHHKSLNRAEQIFGVPADIVVGILGIESLYGQQMGTWRVLDALSTLALDFPAEHPRQAARQAYFRGELGQFLKLAHQEKWDPGGVRGSFAGAMGMPQFMPTSWRKFAVDFDGDGRIDLRDSPADVIGSVANYFKAHGWVAGQPTRYQVEMSPLAPLDALLAPDIVPSFTPNELHKRGLTLLPGTPKEAPPAPEALLAVIELQNGNEAPTYFAGTGNFYAITRYNWSSYYAAAVIELGEAIASQMQAPEPPEPTHTRKAKPAARKLTPSGAAKTRG
jgi:membrane-bound lytic murein transglycosylase B